MSDRTRGLLFFVPLAVALFIAPYFLESFWLQAGLIAMSSAIGAIGLTLLVGITGQLSLAHAFFVAVGAYGYCYLAGPEPPPGSAAGAPTGLGLPTFFAMIGGVALAGLAGALISPVAGRLRGIYLGLASVGLVFIGQHVLQNAKAVTGGYSGRDAAAFNFFGFEFSNKNPENFVVAGVPFNQLERLWYLGLVLVLIGWWYARNLLASRPGRAMQTVRDSEVAAAVMGVNVPVYKAAAFTISSMYAGLAGVFLALANQRIVPEYFDFFLSIDFLVMIVLGGLGSIGGAIIGAAVVSAMPLVLNKYASSLPLVAESGGDGLTPDEMARFLYGGAVIAVLLFVPHGLAGLARRRSPNPKESTA